MSTNCLGAVDPKYKIQIIHTESENLMKQESLPKSGAHDTLAADFNLSIDLARGKFNEKIRLHELCFRTEESTHNHSFLVADCKINSRHFNLSPTIKKNFALIDNLNSSTEDDFISIKSLSQTKKMQFKKRNVVAIRHKGKKENTCVCLVF